MTDEGEAISSLCRMISKPRGRICRKQIGKKRESLRQELDFWGPARGEVREVALLLLYNTLKLRRGLFKGRNDNLSPSGPSLELRLRKKSCIASHLESSWPLPLGLCLNGVQSKAGRQILKPGSLSSNLHFSNY